MVISRLHRPLSLTLATLGLITLVACGGGGGGSNPPPVAIDDTTPNAFSFTATEGAEPNAVITSPTATISGINTATPISISGGEYSIAVGAFTSAAGTITNGQSLVVRLTASDKTNTAKAVTVTIGGVSATFNVTTLVDITADAFSFTAVTGAELNKEYTSEAITVSGIDVAVPVSVSGGLYSINGSEFTSAASTVSAGQTITLKATSGNDTDTTQNAVLSVGSISGTFAVTTIPDTTPPVAEFKFPTPYTMSEANTVKVRGTATDDHAIKSVKVVVTNNLNATLLEIPGVPKTEGDFSSWTAAVPLTALAENEIKVVAKDYRDNEIKIADANKVVIRQADINAAFPNADNQFNSIFQGLVIDSFGDRTRLLIGDSDSVISVDLNTGVRQEIISYNDGVGSLVLDPKGEFLYVSSRTEILEFDLVSGLLRNKFASDYLVNAQAMAIDSSGGNGSNLVLVNSVYSDVSGGDVIGFSLTDKKFYPISSSSNEPFLMMGEGIAFDSLKNRYLIPVGGQFDLSLHGVVAVDRDTGLHSMLSSNAIGDGELFGEIYGSDSAIITAIVDQNSNALLVPEYPNKLFSIDLESGDRKLLANVAYKNTAIPGDADASIGAMDIDNDRRILYAIESLKDSVFAIDLETNEKVILSKSQNNL